MKKQIEKLLKFKQYKHNESAKEIFVLAENLLSKDFDRVEFLEFCLDISIIKGYENYPMIFDDALNQKFWNILDNLK